MNAMLKRIKLLESARKSPDAAMPDRIWLEAVHPDGTVTRHGCIVVKPRRSKAIGLHGAARQGAASGRY